MTAIASTSHLTPFGERYRAFPQISIIPAPHLPVSVERQQKIIDGIKAKLRQNPLQSLLLIGSPGKGKTYDMRAIQKAVIAAYEPRYKIERCSSPSIFTLADWQEARARRVRGESAPLADEVSPERIEEIAAKNKWECGQLQMRMFAFSTLHLFIDEFDMQPTKSDFATSGLESLVNTIYKYAPRKCEGNEQAFCQLVIATNLPWDKFEIAHGIHLARRIDEMCVKVDFDRE